MEREIIRAKGLMDDAATLSEAADLLDAYARKLRALEDDGWELESPIEGDYGYIRLPVVDLGTSE